MSSKLRPDAPAFVFKQNLPPSPDVIMTGAAAVPLPVHLANHELDDEQDRRTPEEIVDLLSIELEKYEDHCFRQADSVEIIHNQTGLILPLMEEYRSIVGYYPYISIYSYPQAVLLWLSEATPNQMETFVMQLPEIVTTAINTPQMVAWEVIATFLEGNELYDIDIYVDEVNGITGTQRLVQAHNYGFVDKRLLCGIIKIQRAWRQFLLIDNIGKGKEEVGKGKEEVEEVDSFEIGYHLPYLPITGARPSWYSNYKKNSLQPSEVAEYSFVYWNKRYIYKWLTDVVAMYQPGMDVYSIAYSYGIEQYLSNGYHSNVNTGFYLEKFLEQKWQQKTDPHSKRSKVIESIRELDWTKVSGEIKLARVIELMQTDPYWLVRPVNRERDEMRFLEYQPTAWATAISDISKPYTQLRHHLYTVPNDVFEEATNYLLETGGTIKSKKELKEFVELNIDDLSIDDVRLWGQRLLNDDYYKYVQETDTKCSYENLRYYMQGSPNEDACTLVRHWLLVKKLSLEDGLVSAAGFKFVPVATQAVGFRMNIQSSGQPHPSFSETKKTVAQSIANKNNKNKKNVENSQAGSSKSSKGGPSGKGKKKKKR